MKDLYIVILSYYTREVLFQSITSCLMMKGINNVIVVSSGNPIEDIKKWLCFFTPSFPIFPKFRRNDSFEASLMKSFY
ncbi:MAG: hypothetical protein EB127_09585 [Alphaproteobacteria bacterium]|nr:hypothetical protein [Alphaproteobacteria bacterium]